MIEIVIFYDTEDEENNTHIIAKDALELTNRTGVCKCITIAKNRCKW